MLLLPGKQDRLARLCQVMYFGERIAHRCAQRQTALAIDERQRRFLRLQARQETVHALLFRGIVSRLDPRGNHAATPAMSALSDYEGQLHRDLDRKDLTASLLGMQGILEGIGEQMLRASSRSLTGQNERYRRLHRLVLQQEASHHAFGQHWLQRSQYNKHALRSISAARLRYQTLAHDLLVACGGLLEDLDIDAETALTLAAMPDAWVHLA